MNNEAFTGEVPAILSGIFSANTVSQKTKTMAKYYFSRRQAI